MCLAVTLFSGMTVLIRLLAKDIPIHEMICMRGVVSVILLMPWFARAGLQALATRRPFLMTFRGALTSIGLMAYIYALARMNLADAVALHFTLPLFGIVLAMVALHEKVNRHRWIAAAVGFLGTLVILRPGIVAFDAVALVVLFSALAYAGVSVVTKVLVRTESSAAIVFHVSAFTAVVFAVPSAIDWVAPSVAQWLMLIGIGAFNVTAQSCLNRSFSAADASFVLPFDFLRLPLTAIAALVLFAEVPDLWTIVGAMIIFGATYYVTWREQRGP